VSGPPRGTRVTMVEVAKAASVSHQTVSNVVNAPHLVRAETRQRVEAVIAETGYRPLRAAQALRTHRSHLIAVTIREAARGKGELHNEFLRALTQRAQRDGYRILLFTAADEDEEIDAYDQTLSDHRPDAFVVTDIDSGDRRIPWLHGKHVPFVTFGRPWSGPADHPWVDVDGAFGERAATEHLIAAGHRRIAFLGWRQGSSGTGDDRQAGWEQALRAASLPTAGLRIEMDNEQAQGRAACARLLDHTEPPTAFVCVSDTIALGAWAEIIAQGQVPGTNSLGAAVIGFDDSSAAAAVGVASVAQPIGEVAEACVAALGKLQAPSRRKPVIDRVLLRPRLVLRASAGQTE